MSKIQLEQSTGKELLVQLKNYFGGEILENKLKLNSTEIKGEVLFYKLFEGMEIFIFDINHDTDIEFIINPLEKKKEEQMIIRFEYSSTIVSDIESINPNNNVIANGIYIHSLGIPFELKSQKSDSTKWLSIRLSQTYLKEYMWEMGVFLNKMFTSDTPWVMYDIIPVEIQLLLQSIFSINPTASTPLRKGIIYGKSIEALGILFDRILSREVSQENEDKGLHIDDFKVMIAIKDYLLSNLDKHVSLEEICDKFYVSNSKLRRDFKKVFGTSLRQFVINTKLEQAKYTLINEGVSITEVARLYGYSSISKFSEAFKKKFGISPKQVAKKYHFE